MIVCCLGQFATGHKFVADFVGMFSARVIIGLLLDSLASRCSTTYNFIQLQSSTVQMNKFKLNGTNHGGKETLNNFIDIPG